MVDEIFQYHPLLILKAQNMEYVNKNFVTVRSLTSDDAVFVELFLVPSRTVVFLIWKVKPIALIGNML